MNTSLPDCCAGEGDPELLSVAAALERVNAQLNPIRGYECVGLRESLGRILAERVVSPFDVPGHVNSAIDGFAVRGADLPDEGEREFPVLGTAFAGKPFEGALQPGTSVRIMTGAVVPEGADTTVMQEHVEFDGRTVRIGVGHTPGQNVRAAGEDIARGSVVLAPGHRLMAAEMGLLASLGIAEVRVYRRLRVAFFSTGDELRSAGETLDPGAIYDSNRYTIHGMLVRLGCELIDMGVVRDQPQAFQDAFLAAAEIADVIMTSGGASTGEADYVKETLDALGSVGFWRIAMRPGRPLAFGRVRDAVFFGLPGNPVAVMATFYQFCQPALKRMMGERDARPLPTLEAISTEALRKKVGRTELYRAILARDADGRLGVRPTGRPGSALLHTMSDANCFIILPAARGPVAAGETVEVQPFFGLV